MKPSFSFILSNISSMVGGAGQTAYALCRKVEMGEGLPVVPVAPLAPSSLSTLIHA